MDNNLVQSTSEKLEMAQDQLDKGQKTLNQVREEFGLEPANNDKFNMKFVKLTAKK